MADVADKTLVGRIVLAGSAILGVLALLCATSVLPVDHGARSSVAIALGTAAAADAGVGLFFLTRSRHS